MPQPSHERHHERRNVTKDDDDIVRQIPAATVCTTGIFSCFCMGPCFDDINGVTISTAPATHDFLHTVSGDTLIVGREDTFALRGMDGHAMTALLTVLLVYGIRYCCQA
jgi:hypothetical protein